MPYHCVTFTVFFNKYIDIPNHKPVAHNSAFACHMHQVVREWCTTSGTKTFCWYGTFDIPVVNLNNMVRECNGDSLVLMQIIHIISVALQQWIAKYVITHIRFTLQIDLFNLSSVLHAPTDRIWMELHEEPLSQWFVYTPSSSPINFTLAYPFIRFSIYEDHYPT